MENSKNCVEASGNLKSTEYANKWYNGTNGECASVYYGVHIPCDIQMQDSDGYINVFQDKMEALKLVKKYKKARFKAFSFYHEAADFAMHGSECPNNNLSIDGILLQNHVADTPPAVGEKPSAFRGPKSQDLVKLRKGIENGDLASVRKAIWDNPRYLISVGDTPSILQEGFRYNGLHVAAKAKNPDMCELLLHTIANVNFIKLLYGEDNHQDPEDRAKILLDLYLNTPDKGFNETPLHFAVKFGALKVVEVLVSFPQCDKTLKNKYGKEAKEIICDRCEGYESKLLRNRIALILEDSFYVPVLRSEDNCLPPVIGEPFSPTSPPRLNKNILDARLEIHAYAGPMNKEGAEKFRKMWKTPPRSSQKMNRSYDSIAKMKFKDPEKGLECLGRVLATELDVGWKEYWPFLSSFVDLASPEGLEQLETYLNQRFNIEYSSKSTSSHSSCTHSPPEQQCDKHSPGFNPEISPMSELCDALQLCTINDHSFQGGYVYQAAKIRKSPARSTWYADKKTEPPAESKTELSPFLYVEKSCQVFAHRIYNDMSYLLETEFGNKDILETQMKQLKLLISSFKDDIRFGSVNFQAVHSRLGSLIGERMKEAIKAEGNHKLVYESIESWLQICGQHFDCFSSDDESINHRQPAVVRKKTTSNNKQLVCLLQCILDTLNNEMDSTSANISSEEECIKAWSQAKPCSCVLQSKNSRKRKLVSKRLSFYETDMECGEITDRSPIITKSCEGSSSDEEYYTPPSSPSLMQDNESDDDEQFDESVMPDVDVFIEGDVPTKVDHAVFSALQNRNCHLNPKDYPNIYRWFHSVSLYSDKEKESWSNANYGRCIVASPSVTSTPVKQNSQPSGFFPSPTPWLRVTGANSPRASLTSFRDNVSFNL